MGFWSRLFGADSYDPAQRVLPDPYEPYIATAGIPVMDPGTPLDVLLRHHESSIEEFWKAQPNLRKVVDFIARNVASIPLHVFDRVGDTERRRITGVPLTATLNAPQPRVGAFRFWHAVLSDGLLYDRWCILVSQPADGGPLQLVHIPSHGLRFEFDALRTVTGVKRWVPNPDGTGDWQQLDMSRLIFDHGYAPRTAGYSPVRTLKDVLDESAEAVRYRRDVWENGARIPGYVSRPATANPANWTSDQRDRFVAAINAAYGRNGSNRGGLPLLEDGMEIKSAAGVFKPQDTDDLEGRRLSAVEVAAAFHVAPELVGAQQGNYSNVKEYRQMLYRDSLGPYIRAWEDSLNTQLLPLADAPASYYIEANVEAKLRGSFEEQAQITQAAVGGPWTTRNEARARQNLPPIPGGDELIVPLNVLVGGQASPQDSGTQNLNEGPEPHTKAAPTRAQRDKGAAMLARFFNRQRGVVLSALGSKDAGDWWDAERWDRELSGDLLPYLQAVTGELAQKTLDDAGRTEQFNPALVANYLAAKAQGVASGINGTTRKQVEAALASEARDVAAVFDLAESVRAVEASATISTSLASFSTVEAGKQSGAGTKTWVTGKNPRPDHAAMDGETVGIDEQFSDGSDWPQGPGCNCVVDINW